MKIIKPGKLPENEIFEAACNYCQCIFQFTRGEATPESTCRNEDFLKVPCPSCKREVWTQI